MLYLNFHSETGNLRGQRTLLLGMCGPWTRQLQACLGRVFLDAYSDKNTMYLESDDYDYKKHLEGHSVVLALNLVK